MNTELDRLEEEIKKDFEALPKEMQSYFQEETLEPNEILNGNYQKFPISKKAGIINRAEVKVRKTYQNNDDLIRAQAYLLSVAQYFTEKANSKAKQTLSSLMAVEEEA